jgi:hypothetical protein
MSQAIQDKKKCFSFEEVGTTFLRNVSTVSFKDASSHTMSRQPYVCHKLRFSLLLYLLGITQWFYIKHMRWAAHVARMGERMGPCTVVVESVERVAMDWMVRGSNLYGGEIFHTRPDQP